LIHSRDQIVTDLSSPQIGLKEMYEENNYIHTQFCLEAANGIMNQRMCRKEEEDIQTLIRTGGMCPPSPRFPGPAAIL
jgi:hypothetical protein